MTWSRIPLATLWLSLGLVVKYLDTPAGGPLLPLQLMSCLTVAFGLWAFLLHGGPQITAAGMWCAATAAFGGYAGLWWANHLGDGVPHALVLTLYAAYFTTVAMFFAFWWDTRGYAVTPGVRDVPTALWATNVGLGLTAVALLAHLSVPLSLRPPTEDAAFIGIVMLALGLTGTRRQFRLFSFRSLVIAAVLGWFVAVAFDGFGRLPVIALGAAVAIVASIRQSTRIIKLVGAAAVPLVAGFLTTLRDERLGIIHDATGPDSDVGGIWTFGRLINLGDHLPFGHGYTLWETVTVWIPRSVWPGKPVGFGTDLTRLLEPQLLSAGHSLVATAFGEWYYNFGWWGLPMMVVVIGLFVRKLDQWRAGFAGSPLDSRRAILLAALTMAAVASMTDFVWAGTFTFAARMLLRTIVVLGLLIFLGSRRRSEKVGPSVGVGRVLAADHKTVGHSGRSLNHQDTPAKR